jgi:Flp pilus assembly protein TadD
MTHFHAPPRPLRRGLILPLAVGLGLFASACASDPYAESVGLNASEKAMAPEDGSAAAAALLRVATATRAAGDYASAINVLKRAHTLAPRDANILIEMGESLAAVRAYNEAREAMVKAIALRPRDTRALRGLGNALVALSEPALAETRYREALAILPEAATYNGLGVALDALNDPRGAEEAYRAGLALDDRNMSLVGNLGLSLAIQDKTPEAIALMAPQLRLGRSNPRLRQNLALVYGLAGRLNDARTVLRIDLDERSVANNIAYYELLRGIGAERRRETVLGRRSVVASRESAAALTVPAPASKDTKKQAPANVPAPSGPAEPPGTE